MPVEEARQLATEKHTPRDWSEVGELTFARIRMTATFLHTRGSLFLTHRIIRFSLKLK